MQSSPVLITECEIPILVELPMRMPSVLGLSAGAVSRTRLTLKLLQAKRLKWELLLLIDRRLKTLELFTKSNRRVCPGYTT